MDSEEKRAMTWGDVKLAVLHKLFVSDGQTVAVNDTTSAYIAAMPQAANEGLLLLASCGKYIPRVLETEAEEELTELCLTDICLDFLSLRENELFCDGRRSTDYTLIGGNRLILQGRGKWLIGYNAYPRTITYATPDSEEIDMSAEAASLLPLYIASQLYRDEDAQAAAMYRNEFEAGREALLMRDTPKSGEMHFVSLSKWI